MASNSPSRTFQQLNRELGGVEFESLYSTIRAALLDGIEPKLVPGCEIAFADQDICWLLYNSIRNLKPRVVVETGCFMGMSTLISASALMHNARDGGPKGMIYTISLDSFYRIQHPMSHGATCARRLGLSDFIRFLEGSSIPLVAMESGDVEIARRREEYMLALLAEGRECLLPRLASLLGSIDFAFLDSLHYEGVQISEIASIFEHLAPRGELIVDDVCFPDYPNAWIINAFAKTNLAKVTLFESNGKPLRVMKLQKCENYSSFYKRFASWWWPGTLQEFVSKFELTPYNRKG